MPFKDNFKLYALFIKWGNCNCPYIQVPFNRQWFVIYRWTFKTGLTVYLTIDIFVFSFPDWSHIMYICTCNWPINDQHLGYKQKVFGSEAKLNRLQCKLIIWYLPIEVKYGLFTLMVFNATFNNISVILWQSVLLVEETRVPREHHWPVASHWQTLSHIVVSSTPHLSGIRTNNVNNDSTDYICRSKSNCQTITTTTVPQCNLIIWYPSIEVKYGN